MSSVMINAGQVGPDTALLINDAGQFVLRAAGRSVGADSAALAEAVQRTAQVAALVTRSAAPIGRMSTPVEQMLLTRFGCTVEETQPDPAAMDGRLAAAIEEITGT